VAIGGAVFDMLVLVIRPPDLGSQPGRRQRVRTQRSKVAVPASQSGFDDEVETDLIEGLEYRANSSSHTPPNLARFACASGTPTGTLPPSSNAADRYASHEAHDSLFSNTGPASTLGTTRRPITGDYAFRHLSRPPFSVFRIRSTSGRSFPFNSSTRPPCAGVGDVNATPRPLCRYRVGRTQWKVTIPSHTILVWRKMPSAERTDLAARKLPAHADYEFR
jgi:hypothetical protein